MAEVEMRNSLTCQCMDFAKHLASQGHSFNFTLKTENFSFNLDITKIRTPLIMTKKKPSPSTMARNAKRKDEFLAMKRNPKSSDAKEKVVADLDTPAAKSNSDEVNDLETLEEITFSCDLCEFVGEFSVDLKMHKNRKHQNIPQLDGENSDNRDTDCWWEKKFSNSLKMFHVFKDVLMDIEESPLSEEEKILQHDIVTNARKEALGSNFQFFPPWNCP